MRETLLNHCKNSSTKTEIYVYGRLLKIVNLVAVGGRYHDKCYKNVKIKSAEVGETVAFEAARFIANYIIENKHECQFSIYSILENFGNDEWPRMSYLKNHLNNIFGDEIIIHSSNKGPIITVKSVGTKILSDHFHKSQCPVPDIKEKRKKIVLEASNIILEDIRSELYDT